MKKSSIFRLILAIVISIIFISIVLICFKNSYKIYNMKNSNKAIEKVNDITIIDVTGLSTGEEANHEHIFKTQYDDDNHWKECILCKNKIDLKEHSYIDLGWTQGNYNSCSEENMHEYICNCGKKYSVSTGRKSHTWVIIQNESTYQYYTRCSICSHYKESHKCRKNDGSEINCNNLGRCILCNYTYTKARHSYDGQNKTELYEKKAYCSMCNMFLGDINYNYKTRESNGNIKHYTSITFPNGSTNIINNDYNKTNDNSTINIVNKNTINELTWNCEQTITYKSYSEKEQWVRSYCNVNINGINSDIFIYEYIKPDEITPIISNIILENNDDWAKSKEIVIKGTENYCNTVKVEIFDDENKLIYSGSTKVNNNNYSISCIPELEASNKSRNFILRVTDTCENMTEKEFSISKIDGIAPTPTSENEIIREWSKEKDITFTAIDQGIGNVYIAFNNQQEYKIADKNEESYSKNYKFIGDVYSPVQAIVYYKDGLGNTSTQIITINKLDNTAPTITNVQVHNNKLTVEANDIKEGMGEGSGITKYRYITSENKLENLEVSETATSVNIGEDFIIPNIEKVKYIYIVAEDIVGNISKSYEYEVPQLILTSKVNIKAANGKGAIELDWSSYDLEDKYFVIYRKQENEAEWKTIVTLEQKLTEGKYIDMLANDTQSPNISIINIKENSIDNNISITSNAIDSSTKYKYYIEAYESTNITLIGKSNITN
ncbi:MAG: hypothetical protein HFJ25_02075 [Clostridia bacterium]|nr:hypothetical protein [Clostridia bacterium]